MYMGNLDKLEVTQAKFWESKKEKTRFLNFVATGYCFGFLYKKTANCFSSFLITNFVDWGHQATRVRSDSEFVP
jgi:hypothetical protein